MAVPASDEALFKDDSYQVFLVASPASFPISFALHPWLVINQKGRITRIGVGHMKANSHDPFLGNHTCSGCKGYIHLNFRPPFEGLDIISLIHAFRWKGTVLASIEGGEGSLAMRMADAISHSVETYPYRDRYAFTGPNSNTYVAWIISQFPESGFRLPWNAFGKEYRT